MDFSDPVPSLVFPTPVTSLDRPEEGPVKGQQLHKAPSLSSNVASTTPSHKPHCSEYRVLSTKTSRWNSPLMQKDNTTGQLLPATSALDIRHNGACLQPPILTIHHPPNPPKTTQHVLPQNPPPRPPHYHGPRPHGDEPAHPLLPRTRHHLPPRPPRRPLPLPLHRPRRLRLAHPSRPRHHDHRELHRRRPPTAAAPASSASTTTPTPPGAPTASTTRRTGRPSTPSSAGARPSRRATSSTRRFTAVWTPMGVRTRCTAVVPRGWIVSGSLRCRFPRGCRRVTRRLRGCGIIGLQRGKFI